MFEKPRVPDSRIVACLRESYGIEGIELNFLPLGNNSYAGVYRVWAENGLSYFVKVQEATTDDLAGVIVPHHLSEMGIKRVIAPIPTQDGSLWHNVDGYTLILYPYVEGTGGTEVRLSDNLWIDLGKTLKKVHATPLTPDLLTHVPQETFIPNPRWTRTVHELHTRIHNSEFDDALQRDLAGFWKTHDDTIMKLVDRAEVLGWLLQPQKASFVLCHGDIHPANVLVDQHGKLLIVDWDRVIIAPKERDLMFIIGGVVAGFEVGEKAEGLFFDGYGEPEIDWLTLAYYRYEWVVQDIGVYGERVFLLPDAGETTRADAAHMLKSLFGPGNLVDAALKSESNIPPEFRG